MRENDVLFFNLHRRYINSTPEYGGFLGIFLLAAFLNSNGYKAQSYAGQLMEGKRLLDYACRNQKVSMIGLYCDYENVTENIFLSQYIKSTYNIPVIVGGPQATALGEEFIDKSQCDAIVRYEGEMTVLELVNFYIDDTGNKAAIDGITYKDNGKLIVNSDRKIIDNLDALPFVTDECFLDFRKRQKELSIMTGRGCPFNCAFCYEGHHTKKVRFRTVDNVLNEIEMFMNSRKNSKEIYILFTDDTFTLNSERVKQLCDGLNKLKEKKPFKWFCEGHIHTLYNHPEMIQYIANAGAQRVQLGIEAGTQKVLNSYRKGSTLDEIRTVVKLCAEAGISQIYSNIILGGAFFTKEVYEEDLKFVKELISLGKGSVEIGVVSFWPLAETSITNNPEKYGIKIVDKDFITSVGDLPQTETPELCKYDIADMMKNMKYEIRKHMLTMLNNFEVPLDKIKNWFSKENGVKAYGIWWNYLIQDIKLFAYYDMLASGEAVTSDELDKNEFWTSHPMRVVSLYSELKRLTDDLFEVCGVELTRIEQYVLCYSTGKLCVTDILDKINEDLGIELNQINMIKILEKLEKNRLIVYSII